jgi:hypothetical protein
MNDYEKLGDIKTAFTNEESVNPFDGEPVSSSIETGKKYVNITRNTPNILNDKYKLGYDRIYNSLDNLNKSNHDKNAILRAFKYDANQLIDYINKLITEIENLLNSLAAVAVNLPTGPERDKIMDMIRNENEKLLRLIDDKNITGVNITGLRQISDGLMNIKDRLIDILNRNNKKIPDGIIKGYTYGLNYSGGRRRTTRKRSSRRKTMGGAKRKSGVHKKRRSTRRRR